MRPDLNTLALPELFATLVNESRLDTLLRMALDEDLGDDGDVTTSTFVPSDTNVRAGIVARADGVVAGLAVVERLLASKADDVNRDVRVCDGSACRRGDVLVKLRGSLASILPLERTLLNTLGHLSGIATLTRRFVDATSGTKAKLCCTRKTTPGWRELEKYAVRCGGGWLHRVGLYDAMLVKDNHIGAVQPNELASALARAARAARARFDLRFVEVEVDTLEQFDAVLSIERGLIDIILLDNFDLDALREAVRRRDVCASTVELEASGGVRLDRVRAIAETGVERISCGAITHSAISLDLAVDLIAEDVEL